MLCPVGGSFKHLLENYDILPYAVCLKTTETLHVQQKIQLENMSQFFLWFDYKVGFHCHNKFCCFNATEEYSPTVHAA